MNPQSVGFGDLTAELEPEVRHRAQLATILRQHGHAGLWQHDWLLSDAVS